MRMTGLQRLRIPGAEALTLEQAYKAMAWLGEQATDGCPMTDTAEEALYRHRQPLLGELSVAFFDTTSLYFEGRGGAALGQRGFSKDFRPQLHQVVLVIVLDGHDRPIASFLWPGNTADVTTLLPVVERLRTRFGIGRARVVADRGMISAATIAGLEAQGIDYILGVRERSTAEVRSTVIDDDGVAVPLTIPRQKGETHLAIEDVVVAGRRYVLCRNEEQARKDAETRTALLAGKRRQGRTTAASDAGPATAAAPTAVIRSGTSIASVHEPVTVDRVPVVEALAVDNSNTARTSQTDQPAMFQISKCPADRLDR
jgi:hypothetical protein